MNSIYKKNYNSIIEHFSTVELTDTIAKKFLIYKENNSTSYNKHYTEKTLPNGEIISVLAVLVAMSDSDYNNDYNIIIKNASNVSDDIKNIYSGFDTKRTEQKATPEPIIAYNSLKDVVSNYMDLQDEAWKNIYNNDPEFQIKLNDYRIEQNALSEEQQLNNNYNTIVNNYDKYSNNMYNNHRMKSRNKYIHDVQNNIIQTDILKDKMLSSDIMTKQREIQLLRYAYLQKKKMNDCLKLTAFIFILIIIILSIAKLFPNISKNIIGILVGILFFIWIILIVGKMIRNSKRYGLDFDEVNFGNYKENSCSK